MHLVKSYDEQKKKTRSLKKAKGELRRFFRARLKGVRESHSQGPWDLDREDQGRFYDSSRDGLCLEVGVGVGRRLCKHDSRWHSNALLIEAAPVMYAELKNLVRKLEAGVAPDEVDMLAAKNALKLAKMDCEVHVKY